MASKTFDSLVDDDWLEAFAGHPRIGERGDQVANREQRATAGAAETTLTDLAEINLVYEQRHGFTYLVYASGKTAEEMLAIARSRVGNATEDEIANASLEQRSITETRLRRMLCMDDPG
jgi:OHCU decarboxylase